MTHSPRITVLMTLFNGERYLREAIESILNQTYGDFEFLIIDDASTDSSKNIILSYNDSRIRLIVNEINIGFVLSLNKGLQLAKGKYIARMDADDAAIETRLEKQLDYISNNSNVGLVTCCWETIDEESNSIFKQNEILNFEERYYVLHFKNCIVHSSVLFNKKLVLNLGGYNKDFATCEDYDLWCRIANVSKIEQVEDILVKWRYNKSGISNRSSQKQDLCAQNVFSNNIKVLISNNDGIIDYLDSRNYYFINTRKYFLNLMKIHEVIYNKALLNNNVNLDILEEIFVFRIFMNMLYLIKKRRFLVLFFFLRTLLNKKDVFTFIKLLLSSHRFMLNKMEVFRIPKNIKI